MIDKIAECAVHFYSLDDDGYYEIHPYLVMPVVTEAFKSSLKKLQSKKDEIPDNYKKDETQDKYNSDTISISEIFDYVYKLDVLMNTKQQSLMQEGIHNMRKDNKIIWTDDETNIFYNIQIMIDKIAECAVHFYSLDDDGYYEIHPYLVMPVVTEENKLIKLCYCSNSGYHYAGAWHEFLSMPGVYKTFNDDGHESYHIGWWLNEHEQAGIEGVLDAGQNVVRGQTLSFYDDRIDMEVVISDKSYRVKTLDCSDLNDCKLSEFHLYVNKQREIEYKLSAEIDDEWKCYDVGVYGLKLYYD
eukprot:Mrub_06084.p1 GENE.Mrub_06084~~Mrub_06084.p1  ORF type:complete len:330 (-),score=74.82 Mrub_06084:59-958(-)